jgi:dihydrofolate reductase
MATATDRKLVLKMSVSLDGFVASPSGELDWVFRTSSADSRAWVVDTLREADVHVMGSRSYYDMAAFWPYSDTPFTAPMNDVPKVVFSRTGIRDGTRGDRTAPDRPEERPGVSPTAAVLKSWAEPMVARGDLAEEVRRLKAQPGHVILAHGGVRFARSLAVAGLIDEYRLVVHPVALGQGQALFSELHSPVDLRLISATPFSSGAVALVYRPA